MKEQDKGQDQKTSTQTELWNLSRGKVSANVVPRALVIPGRLPQKEVTKEEKRPDQFLNKQSLTRLTNPGGTTRLRTCGHLAKVLTTGQSQTNADSPRRSEAPQRRTKRIGMEKGTKRSSKRSTGNAFQAHRKEGTHPRGE